MTREEAIEILEANRPDPCYQMLREAVDFAVDALKAQIDKDINVPNTDCIYRQATIDERRYTFGNDEFSLEAAYHDCKLVFDGITDDDSFQKADTGLILYYANEIIYALHEALEGKDTNVLSNDCISRQAAIEWCLEGLNNMPSAQPERKTGKWIHIRTEEDGNALYECSVCHKGEIHVPIVEVSYCWNCGARMDGDHDEG